MKRLHWVVRAFAGIGVVLLVTSSCRDPRPRDVPDAAPGPPPVPSAAPSAPAPEVSAAPPAPGASAQAAAARCPDAGAIKDSPVRFGYVQVFVPTPGQRTGTTFAVNFHGHALALPPASEIYPSCSVEATTDPTRFELRCQKRKDPICTVQLREDSVTLECGSEHHVLDVPCGVRARVRPGRLPGTVSYH